MSRSKSISSEELIRLLDEYRLENPGSKIKIPKFGEYIRSKGYNVQEYTIRRSQEFRKYLISINQNSEEQIYNDIVTYKSIDVDAFLAHNNTKDKLREALITRDRYYARISAHAAEAIRKRKIAEDEIDHLKERIAELESELTNVQAKANNKDIRQKNELISKLRAILSSYIYPDAANAMLKKDGILDVLNSLIPDEAMKQKEIYADTEISLSKYGVVNNLFGGFDE